MASDTPRTLGLLGATGIGVGAIVGGGILALAGVAFATTGPSAILAFAANGAIAVLTALAFAEMSASFPESGGTYTFAKKVLTVEAAFMVGWVVWLASIVAAVLYALGFATFAAVALEPLAGGLAEQLAGRPGRIGLALAATAFYTFGLSRRSGGGGRWETIGKVLVFLVLVAGGLWALAREPGASVAARLTPFFAAGGSGLLQAMGYTFIALQGFDLIAAVAGEVRDPGRTIPRAMLLSLGTALAIYLPLLLIVATVGVAPGGSITADSAANPDTVVADAVRNFLGPAGYWLVIVAAVLSMLSALHANLLAASRMAAAMARDRTLPAFLGQLHPARGTPVAAVSATAATVALILLVVPDVAAAGAMSSLIFLVSFALAHGTNVLTRRRGGARRDAAFRLPLFPLIPLLGGLACTGLAIFQGFAVPTAGLIAALWLAVGGGLYFALFARRARVVDAAAEALDPQLVRLRGRNPLVLVPIANPASAAALVTVASALAPPAVGRVLLLSVVQPPRRWQPGVLPRQLVDTQQVLGESLAASFAGRLAPEALITVAERPWAEIARVARTYRCASLLLGLGELTEGEVEGHVEQLMSAVDSDVVVLRAPPEWDLASVRRVLVPMGGRRDQSDLRARLLGSLERAGPRQITFLAVFPPDAPRGTCAKAHAEIVRMARDEVLATPQVEAVRGESTAAEIARRAADSDLIVLGAQRLGNRRKAFGDLALRVARATDRPILLISRRG